MNDEDFLKSQALEYLIFEKYQTTIHNDKPKNITEFVDFLVETPFVKVEVHIFCMCLNFVIHPKVWPLLYCIFVLNKFTFA